jgi:hypothetical protein
MDITAGGDGGTDEDLDISTTGVLTEMYLTSAATANDAMALTASAGGIDITAAKVMDITTSANDANITVDPHGSGTLALGTADNTAVNVGALAVNLTSDGTPETAMALISTNGGIDITAAKAIDITTSANNTNITVNPNGSGTLALGSQSNTTVTVDAIALSLDATGGASNMTLTANSAEDDLTIEVAGAHNSSLFLKSSGTDVDAMALTASVGGIDITAAQAIDITTSHNNANITIDPHNTGTLALGTASNTAVNVGANVITATSVAALTLTDGTASFELGGTGATTLSGATTVTLVGSDHMQLNSSGGAISIGNDDNDFAINIGTQGERTISIGTGAFADVVTIGNVTGITDVNINSGTGGTAIASTGLISITTSENNANIQ